MSDSDMDDIFKMIEGLSPDRLQEMEQDLSPLNYGTINNGLFMPLEGLITQNYQYTTDLEPETPFVFPNALPVNFVPPIPESPESSESEPVFEYEETTEDELTTEDEDEDEDEENEYERDKENIPPLFVN
tara:strand:- start:5211 stop:5600 length:390 start_codon:yes stop_codon:yes gene_type:complete